MALEPITRDAGRLLPGLPGRRRSGIFFATVEWGSADNISWEDYERFGQPFDMRVLEAVEGRAVQRVSRLPRPQSSAEPPGLPGSRLPLGRRTGEGNPSSRRSLRRRPRP